MYPNLYYAFKDLFGVEWKFLRFVNSFGFFVAIAFILAAIILVSELRRKSKQGLLATNGNGSDGWPAGYRRRIDIKFSSGFLLGYKIIALLLWTALPLKIPRLLYFHREEVG
jgi:hypothetical protein